MTKINDYDNVLNVPVGNIYLVSKTSDQSSKHVLHVFHKITVIT